MIGRGPQIADAVVAELRDPARVWNTDGTMNATREWLPVWKPDDIKTLRVAVVPLTLENERLARSCTENEDYDLAIDFQCKVTLSGGAVVNSQIDALDLKAQQVYDFYKDAHFLANVNGDNKSFRVLHRKRQDIYDLTRLYTEHTWETMILLTVRGII